MASLTVFYRYYVQTNVMPPKISFNHPLGPLEEVQPTSPPAPNRLNGIPSPPVTPEAPRPLPNPAAMVAPPQPRLSSAQMLYASANRTATPTSSFIGGHQTLSPLNERATLTPRALPKPPVGGRPQNDGMQNHHRSSTLGTPLQQQTLPSSIERSTGLGMAGSYSQPSYSQRPGHHAERSASYPAAPLSQTTALPNRMNTYQNFGKTGGPSVPHLVTKAQNPTQQANASLVSASQVPTPLLFSSAPPSGLGYQQNPLPPLPTGQTSINSAGSPSSQTSPSSAGTPGSMLSAAQVPTPPLFSSAAPIGGAFQNSFPQPTGQAPASNTGNTAKQMLPGSMGMPPGAASLSTLGTNPNMAGKPSYLPTANNNIGKPPNFIPQNLTGNAPSFMSTPGSASNFNQTNFTGNSSQAVSPSASLPSPPMTMNGQSFAMSPNGQVYNASSALAANTNAKPPKMDHAAMSQSVKQNARQTAEALRQAGRAVGNATKKVAASTANRFLLGVDFLSALTVALLDPKTGKPTVDQGTLHAIYQGQPGADYAGAINALLIQQQQQPAKTAQYQTLIQQIQVMQAQAIIQQQQQQQQQQGLPSQQTGTGLQVNAQVDLGGLQLNAQFSKPLGQQNSAGNGQNQQQPAKQQQQNQQQQQQQAQQQQFLQQQLAQQQAANQQLMAQLQQQQAQQQQLQQQQFQQLQQQQLEQALQQQQQQQQGGQFDLMQQLLQQAEATSNQQLDAQLQQQMLFMQQQSQTANQAMYEVQMQQTLSVSAEQQPGSEDLVSQLLMQAQEATANSTGGVEGMFGGFDPSQMLSGLSGGMDMSSLTSGVDLSGVTGGMDLSSMTSGMDLSSLTGGLESSLSGLSLEF
jgi:hypothetical protein